MKHLVTTALGTTLNTLSYIAPEQTGRLGFRLFCRPLRTRLRKKHLKYLNKAKPEDLQVDGHRIRVYRWGSGPRKVFFMHGWQSHTYRWKPYIESLDPDEFTVFALDAPGHGLSGGSFLSVPLLSRVIVRVIEKYGPFEVLTGHSLGGFTLLYVLYHHPGIAPEKLILLAVPGEAEEFLKFYQETLHLTDRTVNQTRDHFEKVFSKSPSYFSAIRFASGLTLKGLIIHDEDDRETPVQNALDIHKVWPASEIHITQGMGHNLRSQEIVNEVTHYIRKNK